MRRNQILKLALTAVILLAIVVCALTMADGTILADSAGRIGEGERLFGAVTLFGVTEPEVRALEGEAGRTTVVTLH